MIDITKCIFTLIPAGTIEPRYKSLGQGDFTFVDVPAPVTRVTITTKLSGAWLADVFEGVWLIHGLAPEVLSHARAMLQEFETAQKEEK